MENASKALMMAGTVLIALMVISALVFMYRDLTSEKRQESENQKVEETAEFNKSFESYEKDLKGTQMFSIANKIIDYNEKYAGKDGYEEITLTVHTDRGNKNAQYYAELQADVDQMINEKYKSSSNLEALYEARNNETSTDEKTRTQVEQTIKELQKELGDKYNAAYQNVIRDWNQYSKYKDLKTKTYKSDGITYYSNGRIKTMIYTQK